MIINGNPLILVFYLDDLFLMRAERYFVRCRKEMVSEFEMKDIDLMQYL